jgi:hypothetical protein
VGTNDSGEMLEFGKLLDCYGGHECYYGFLGLDTANACGCSIEPTAETNDGPSRGILYGWLVSIPVFSFQGLKLIFLPSTCTTSFLRFGLGRILTEKREFKRKSDLFRNYVEALMKSSRWHRINHMECHRS